MHTSEEWLSSLLAFYLLFIVLSKAPHEDDQISISDRQCDPRLQFQVALISHSFALCAYPVSLFAAPLTSFNFLNQLCGLTHKSSFARAEGEFIQLTLRWVWIWSYCVHQQVVDCERKTAG